MAAVIFHGAPGSYKTSSAIWFEMLSALRDGRIVVTNIEGMKTIDDIEKELDERFPETADIWRISTQKRKGSSLMRRFFHWCPIGAQIIIDEVQDVFPTERTFKPDDYDYQPLVTYQGDIKPAWYDTHISLLNAVKPDDLTSADVDDLGELVFDENGHIIYPATLKESFMRHRKYNWDIIVCTPDITQVNMLIRGCCEAAFHHASKDVIGSVIPYYKRRPRIRQHGAKENGLTPKKSDVTNYRKVPLEVHKLYKSTSTGKTGASGVGKTPFQSAGFRIGLGVLVLCVIYFAFFLGGAFDSDVPQANTESGEANTQEDAERVPDDSSVSGGRNSRQADTSFSRADVFVDLPFQPMSVHLTSYQKVFTNGVYQGVIMSFEFETENGTYVLSSQDIRHLGLKATFVDDCIAKLSNEDSESIVLCKPSRPNDKPQLSTVDSQLPSFL